MKKYTEMNHDELLALKKELDKEFEEIKAQGLALDMSRGKPSNAQLDLSMEMMDVLKGDSNLKCETGVDCLINEKKIRVFPIKQVIKNYLKKIA